MDFTAGITLSDGTVLTADVKSIDAAGITYATDRGERVVSWSEIQAVMLATSDHMLSTGGYMFSVAESLKQAQPYEADEMKRRGARLLADAAPRLCPLGDECPLARRGLGPDGKPS